MWFFFSWPFPSFFQLSLNLHFLIYLPICLPLLLLSTLCSLPLFYPIYLCPLLCCIFFLLSYFSSTPPDLFSTSSWFFLFSLLSLLLFYVSTRFCIILFSACILLRLQFLSPSNFLCFCLVDAFPLLLSSYFQLQFLFLHRVPWAVLVFFILLTFFLSSFPVSLFSI